MEILRHLPISALLYASPISYGTRGTNNQVGRSPYRRRRTVHPMCVVSLAYVCGAWCPWRVAPSTVGFSCPLGQLILLKALVWWFPGDCFFGMVPCFVRRNRTNHPALEERHTNAANPASENGASRPAPCHRSPSQKHADAAIPAAGRRADTTLWERSARAHAHARAGGRPAGEPSS